jgi:hypothetical protein
VRQHLHAFWALAADGAAGRREALGGLVSGDVARVVEDHLRSHRRLYVSGFSDAYFGMVQSAIRKAIELKHPARDHVDDEPERPRPSGKRRGIREIYTAGGYADAIDDREDTNSIGEDA